jgi:uncharacterized protein YneR
VQKDVSPQGKQISASIAAVAKKNIKRKKQFGAVPDKKKVPIEELEVWYMKNGRKVYVNFSDDSDDEDYIAEDSSNNN